MENIINNFRNIIIGAFLFGLFYRVARSLVFDNFIWIVVFPLVAIWLIYKGVLKTFKFNSLDRIFYYYFLYGIVITIVGLVVSPGNKVNPDTFLHVYLPAPLYFISRIYYYYRIEKSTELYRWLMIISGILILDIFIEYYVFIITESSESIPWVRHSMKGAESWGVAIWNYSSQSYDAPTNFMTIFASAKTGGLFVATIFCALLPLAVAGRIK